MLKDSFSKDGYIINQGIITDVKNGRYYSCRNGCGWIAAWNFLRFHGIDISVDTVQGYLSNHLRFGGFLGTKPTHIKAYLEGFGFRIKRVFRKKKALQLSKTINSGIVMYFHNRGAHFVAFYRENAGEFRFLNAIYGDDAHFATMEEFFRDQCFINLMYFMGVE